MFLGSDCSSDDDCKIGRALWSDLDCFVKKKDCNSQRYHSGRFRITQTAISPYIGISGSGGHAAIAIAQRSSSNGSHHKVNRFWNRYVRASCDRKHQAPEKFQAPTAKDVGSDWLEFEDWSFFGFWRLGFGAYHNTSTYHDA